MSAKFHHSTILAGRRTADRRSDFIVCGKCAFFPSVHFPHIQRTFGLTSEATPPIAFVEAKLKKCPIYSHFLKENFCIFKIIQIFVI
jgi:hypothetical protein